MALCTLICISLFLEKANDNNPYVPWLGGWWILTTWTALLLVVHGHAYTAWGVWSAILHGHSELMVALSAWFDPVADWMIFAFATSVYLSVYINHVFSLKDVAKAVKHVIIIDDLIHYPLFLSLFFATLLHDQRYWAWTVAALTHHAYDLVTYMSLLYRKPELISQKLLLFGTFAMTIFVWLGVNGSSYPWSNEE